MVVVHRSGFFKKRNHILWNNYTCPLIVKVLPLLLFFFISIAGCHSSEESDSNITLDWEIDPSPARVGLATINFVLRDSLNQPIEGADVELEGMMSHPGMQPVFAEGKETTPGNYSADFEFTMAGDWIINFITKLEEEKVVEQQVRITGVRARES